jgi:hypothetical protein
MKEKNAKNDDGIATNLNKRGFVGIYILLALLYYFCCSINSIIREKKGEIVEKLEISKKDIDLYGIILQGGRLFGAFLIISYALKLKSFKKMEYFTPLSILFKSIFFLIYYKDLKKEDTIYVQISIFFQGIFHSLINIFFPIWINHFIDPRFQLLSLSISIGVSPFSDIFGIFISKFYNIRECSLLLFIIILILTLIFLVIAYKYNNYFDLTISINRSTGEYERNFEINKEFIKHLNCETIFGSKNQNRWPFISIVFARAILKFSFVGIHYCMKDYYDELDGDGKLNKMLIFYFPLIGLVIGAFLSFSECFKYNSTILIISFLIGFTGVLTCFSNKFFFGILIITFYSLANLIIPTLIQKSFDCFEKKQLHEISYTFNCFFYFLIGNLFSSGLNYFLQDNTNDLMYIYLLIVWANLFLIFIYISKIKIKKENPAPQNKLIQTEDEELKEIVNKP